MRNEVAIGEVLHNAETWQFIDVRSPGEYASGHIPGAVNLPLFTDAERARVGTLYKQTSPEAAMKEGLAIAGTRMPEYLENIQPFLNEPNKTLLIHCWRGGKRSEAMQWLFSFCGIGAARLEGGYRSYRNKLHEFLNEQPFDLRILGGHTGSGKTEILNELEWQGQQVIHLERLAHHKGSAFGTIGETIQPTNEQFENELFAAILKLDFSRPIWIENESRNIGRVYIPEALWHKMRSSKLYAIEVGRDVRLKRVLSYYSDPADPAELRNSFDKIRKRLGGLDYQNAIKAIELGDLETAASIALKYYDKMYTFQIGNWTGAQVIKIGECEEIKNAAKKLINLE